MLITTPKITRKEKDMTKSALQREPRSSGFELLRIIAMLMIVLHHHILHNQFNPVGTGWSLKQLAYVFMVPGGKIGVVIFFGISAWFLCESRSPTVKSSLKRIWILEREVLFYSIGLMTFYCIYNREKISLHGVIVTLFPVTRDTWWYITSYVLFLLFYPFINESLHKLGRSMHGKLCLVIAVIWLVVYGLLPGPYFDFEYTNFLAFIYLYILIAYYRWYMTEFSSAVGWLLIALGTLIFGAASIACDFLYYKTGASFNQSRIGYLGGDCKLPTIIIGFGALIIASHQHFVSAAINYIAGSTLAVYLIHDYPTTRTLLASVFNIAKFYDSGWAVLLSVGIALLIFLACICIDIPRRAIWRVRLDKQPGKLFEVAYTQLEKVGRRLKPAFSRFIR